MHGFWLGLSCVAALVLGAEATQAQNVVKIGMMNVTTGQFADAGTQLDNGVKLYMQQHGDTVAGKKIEIIRRDVGGIAPDVAKRLAQELVVRDGSTSGRLLAHAQCAGGCRRVGAGQEIHGGDECGDVDRHDQVALDRGCQFTRPQVIEPFGAWAVQERGARKVYTMVTDYGPAMTSRRPSRARSRRHGGEIIGSVRYPVANVDFSAFVQRAKDMNPESIFVFVPGGAQSAALGQGVGRARRRSEQDQGSRSGEATAEQALKSMGDTALGIITAWHYDYNRDGVSQSRSSWRRTTRCTSAIPDFFSLRRL